MYVFVLTEHSFFCKTQTPNVRVIKIFRHKKDAEVLKDKLEQPTWKVQKQYGTSYDYHIQTKKVF